MDSSLTFLTPLGGLLALLVLVPLAAFVLMSRRLRRVRAVLGLGDPDRRGMRWRAIALASVPLLLALAAAQPALRRHHSESVRPDAAVFAVVDTSASMAAASGPVAPTRLARAQSIAVSVAAGLGGVPIGVATFTDRVLPNLFPTPDQAAFDSTIRSLTIESPPPRETAQVATGFAALDVMSTDNFFTPTQKHRVLLLITDGESRPFDAGMLAHTLATRPRLQVVVVRVGGGGDRLHTADGRASGIYRPDPEGARRAISQLVQATGGRSFSGGPAGVATAVRSELGPGPTAHVTVEPEVRSLAPFVVLLSLFPVVLVLTGMAGTFRTERSPA